MLSGIERSPLIARKTEERSEEDHPRGRRRGGRNHGSRLVRLGWRGALPDADWHVDCRLVEHRVVHTFNVVVNPCDGSFTGTGVSDQGHAFDCDRDDRGVAH